MPDGVTPRCFVRARNTNGYSTLTTGLVGPTVGSRLGGHGRLNEMVASNHQQRKRDDGEEGFRVKACRHRLPP